jgi:hypothetical protein
MSMQAWIRASAEVSPRPDIATTTGVAAPARVAVDPGAPVVEHVVREEGEANRLPADRNITHDGMSKPGPNEGPDSPERRDAVRPRLAPADAVGIEPAVVSPPFPLRSVAATRAAPERSEVEVRIGRVEIEVRSARERRPARAAAPTAGRFDGIAAARRFQDRRWY